jgi:hypothetical protein
MCDEIQMLTSREMRLYAESRGICIAHTLTDPGTLSGYGGE